VFGKFGNGRLRIKEMMRKVAEDVNRLYSHRSPWDRSRDSNYWRWLSCGLSLTNQTSQ
jgi:hypothetical protein